MKTLEKSIAVFILMGAGLFVAGTSFRATPPPDGAALYKQKCAMCHKADGTGYPALKTQDLTDPKWQKNAKDKEIEEVIKNGKKGTAMPAFADKLKEDEIKALTGYIRSLDSSKKK
jgi:cbb3-type cytochrome c oxidase subunit III